MANPRGFSYKFTGYIHRIGFSEDLWKRFWKLEEHFHFQVVRASAVAKYWISSLQLDFKWEKDSEAKNWWYLPILSYLSTLPACLPALGSHAARGLPSPALESERSRTSIDESGNRHREVLSKSWASSSVNWAVVSRAASMAWRMNHRRPEGICSQSGRKENNTYNR